MAISPDGDPQSRHHRKRQWKKPAEAGRANWMADDIGELCEGIDSVARVFTRSEKCY